MREQKQLKSIFLSPKALKTILSVVVNVSLCLVPLFASEDYISTNAGQTYLEYLSKLQGVREALITDLV